tara:strand:+ start:363 stop:836 length:474 start_codon:yes stop_codon:yes gene_type:complete
MISHFEIYLTIENIYLWANYGVIPFWLMLIFIPNYRITQVFVNSVIIPLILTCAYIYIINQALLLDVSIFEFFKLYINLDELYTVFATETFLLIFWLHFLTLNIFIGGWLAQDAIKYVIPRSVAFLPLILVYFSGPVGLVSYWFIRIFYAKKIKFHD